MFGRRPGRRLDFYSPDLYGTNFEEWCQRYHRNGNPLYMPETRGGAAGAANVFYALGEEAGIGFFAVRRSSPRQATPIRWAKATRRSRRLTPLLLEHQSAGDVHGFVLDHDRRSVDFTMNGYTLHVTLDSIFGGTTESGFGMIMADGKDAFLGVGKGFRVSFTPRPESGPQAGIGAITEGKFDDGNWIAGRRLNGDENDQGKFWRFDSRGSRNRESDVVPV